VIPYGTIESYLPFDSNDIIDPFDFICGQRFSFHPIFLKVDGKINMVAR
jgi:hypothetical protein